VTVTVEQQQVDTYRRDGYLRLPQVFGPDEVAAWHAECERLLQEDWTRTETRRAAFRKIAEGGKVIERLDPVVDVSETFREVVDDERLRSVAGAILGDEPLLFKDKLIFKLPGMGGYKPHQDWAWWQMCPPDDVISVMVAIDGANAANGAIEVFPTYHRELLSAPGELRDMTDEEAAQIDPQRGVIVETTPGDVLIFHSLLPHRSGENTSADSRRQLYLSYSAARHGDFYEDYYSARRERLAQKKSAKKRKKPLLRRARRRIGALVRR
jgi:ectoine hydroxylase-related dioxygenase (phytanoyl-CoA dioxygenase family)